MFSTKNKLILLFVLVIVLPLYYTFFLDRRPIRNEVKNIKGVVSYRRSFGDLNKLHLEAAKEIGISPIPSREVAKLLKGKLKEVKSNSKYAVDSLTHSIPFLVGPAEKLLGEIGVNFQDSLQAKGINPNRIIVTSVLRTTDDVKKLRKRNINASLNSAHFYGTTFDVSWKRFEKVESNFSGRPYASIGADTLKLVLSEVLRDLKQLDKCYVKYELRQGCFHITAR